MFDVVQLDYQMITLLNDSIKLMQLNVMIIVLQ